jgi:membrane protease YdiL (CAAX protease family)
MVSIARRWPVASFVVATYAFSWLAWVAGFVAFDGGALGFASVVVGGFGPMAGAVAVTWLRGESLRAWLAPQLRLRVPLRWYLVALAIPVSFTVAYTAYLAAVGVSLQPAILVERLPTFLGSLAFVFVLGGGQEEFGWRAFMLPRLQRRWNPLSASAALGLVWAVWHLPLFVLPSAIYAQRPFASYVPMVIALAVVYTWLYNHADRALPVVMLLHAGTNSAAVLIPVPATVAESAVSGHVSHAIPFAVSAAVVAAVVAVGSTRLGLHDREPTPVVDG